MVLIFTGSDPLQFFYNNSYVFNKLPSSNLKNIDDYLFTGFRKDIENKDRNLAGNINDILIKIGFIYFSRDMVK